MTDLWGKECRSNMIKLRQFHQHEYGGWVFAFKNGTDFCQILQHREDVKSPRLQIHTFFGGFSEPEFHEAHFLLMWFMSYHINHYINVCFLYVLFPGGMFLFPSVAFFSCTNKNHVPSDGFHLKSPQGPQQAAPDHILKNYGSLENIFPPSQVVTPRCFGGSFR